MTTTLTGRYVRMRGHLRGDQRGSAPPATSTWAAPTASTTAPRPAPAAPATPPPRAPASTSSTRSRAGPRLAAHQHLAQRAAHRQREHQPDLQRASGTAPRSTSTARAAAAGTPARSPAVFDHEWGHGIDDNDANGALSNSSEGYADIAAIYRLQASCVGHGFFWTARRRLRPDRRTAPASTPTRPRPGASHCATDCSGVRDADSAKHTPEHAGHRPRLRLHAAASTGTGPCGRQVHCAAAPARQAAWDLVARDLPARRSTSTARRAFIVGNKLFYQGSGNIGTWHACTCGGIVQRLRRHQRLHAVAHRRRRQRQPERRHAAHDGDLQRLQPPRHRLRDPHRRPTAAAPAGPRRRRTPHRHPRQLPGGALLERRSPAPPATGCSAPRATPAATSARP